MGGWGGAVKGAPKGASNRGCLRCTCAGDHQNADVMAKQRAQTAHLSPYVQGDHDCCRMCAGARTVDLPSKGTAKKCKGPVKGGPKTCKVPVPGPSKASTAGDNGSI